jgi:hypothetical protein
VAGAVEAGQVAGAVEAGQVAGAVGDIDIPEDDDLALRTTTTMALQSNVLERAEYAGRGEQKFVYDYTGRAVIVHNDLPASLKAFPRGLVAVTVRPLPWEEGTTRKRFAAGFESILWLPLYLLAGFGAWVRRRDFHLIGLPVTLVVAVVLSSAVTQGNLGTAFRHRGQILFALSILSMAAVEVLLDRRRGREHGA